MSIIKNHSLWVKMTVIAILAVAALAVVSAGAVASSGCKKVSGKFTLQPVTGPTCTSTVDICATGTYKGGIKGNNNFIGSSLIPTVDTPTTGVVLLTGDNVIHTDKGDLLTKDAIVLHTTGAGEFAEVDTIVGGTRIWNGASGVIQAIGTFTNDGGEGEYRGEICTP
ncbi:MAG: hypothetical protein HYR94_01050 [Chloroflexi bacterium]|nr:hypothetical protein [Chloroflexota bacterium]